MRDEEVEGVLGHEITHISNGDMVTMTLLQGVINAFVMFFARLIAYAIANRGDSRDRGGDSGGGPPLAGLLPLPLGVRVGGTPAGGVPPPRGLPGPGGGGGWGG